MEENSAAVERLIVFYINTKHILKTKQLVEKVFIDQMVKHCKENGFNNYSYEDIKTTWENLVLKYLHLKSKGTTEEKECWKYFEILDSCYEQSDFHNGVYPKFSEEMVWFLIECFLKRKALKKTQKQNSIVTEIHKEFLRNGYLYITKQDIENKWKTLNLKYEKLNDDPESLRKWPYLHALTGFHEEDGKHIVNMVFTKELTEILIERFTEKRITCVIHGYDSDQVLNEIQSEFKDLGFYFSKEQIKEKWRTLTNIYKFLIGKTKSDNTWIHFNAMKNHFQDLFHWDKTNKNDGKESDDRPRCLRKRSKSVGADAIRKDMAKLNLVVQLDKVSPLNELKSEGEEKIHHSRKNRPVKRTRENYRRRKSYKKLRVQGRTNTNQWKSMDQVTENCENGNHSSDISSLLQAREIDLLEEGSRVKKLSLDLNPQNKTSTDLASPKGKVHIINIDHSDIDQNSGNLTINLPSITKQFSDNEFLPLKKRLRIDGENSEKPSETLTETKDSFSGYPTKQVTNKKFVTDTSDNKRLTEEEMTEIMKRIDIEKSQNCDENNKINNLASTNYYGPEEFSNYQNIYGNFGQQCLIVPKEEHQDSVSIQNYNNTVPQPPLLLLVIKVDGSNNPLKENVPNEVNIKMDSTGKSLKESPCESNKEIEKKIDSSNTQGAQSNIFSRISTDTPKTINPKRKMIILSKKRDLIPLEVNSCEHSTALNNSNEVVSDLVNSTNSQIVDCNSEGLLIENEQATVPSVGLNNDNREDVYIENNEPADVCTVGKNVTVYTTDENQSEQYNVENKTCKTQKTEELVFCEPLPVCEKAEDPTKYPKKLDNNPVTIIENNAPLQAIKCQASPDKVKLPVKGGGKLKKVFISSRELNKIAKLKPEDFKVKINNSKKVNETKNTPTLVKKMSDFKFMSQVIKPATTENSPESKGDKKTMTRPKIDSVTAQSTDDNSAILPQPLKTGSKFSGVNSCRRTGKNEEFENESVMSEAIGDDDGLKDNLLATVIDFQEQNNQEFIEIKNLMKQNNLLQRETNRLLRLMLEKQ